MTVRSRSDDARKRDGFRAPSVKAHGGAGLLQAPRGMADLLPPEAGARRTLTRRVLRSFERSGYALVTPPIIEHAEVIARGGGTLESRELVRFVEPESGEVVVLRPDITPQIARIVASHLRDHPAPVRLCYEGRVFRRQHGRARNRQQVSQAGVELIGVAGIDADVEIIALAIRACEEAGLTDFRIELSDIRLVRSLFDSVAAEARDEVSAIVARKDATELRALAKKGLVPDDIADQLADLLTFYGEQGVLSDAARRFRSPEAVVALKNLTAITTQLTELGLGSRIVFDLSETRGLAYYTGMRFGVLASGPGEAIGGGGRYDDLLTRFGVDAPATGFAIDLGNLQWTLRAAGRSAHDAGEVRVVVSAHDARSAREIAERLRGADMVAATLLATGEASVDQQRARARCLAFAQAWGYDVALVATARGSELLRVPSTNGRALTNADLDTIRRLAIVQTAGFETLKARKR
jgi:ATP phosphoribosyltransferase regulatory subunit